MRRIVLTSIISIIGTLLIGAVLLEMKAQADQRDGAVIERIDSELLGEERELLIHLPRNYGLDQHKSYPVMVVLDGTSQDFHTANKVQILSSAGVIPELIVVGIPNTNRNRDLTPDYMLQELQDSDHQMGRGDAFLSFLEQEAMPYIDQTYRTQSYRMLAGNSRGGLFVMYALLENPNVFDAYFCYSPAFWRENNLIVSKTKAAIESEDSLNAFLYMSLGTEEIRKMKGGFDAMTNQLQERNVTGLEFHFDYTKNAGHGNNAHYSTSVALKKWGDYYRKGSLSLR